VNHPADPGGATNYGVTQAVYNKYRRTHRKSVRPVKEIQASEVADIYRTGYWHAVAGDKLPAGVDYATFDAAVNSGPARAKKWLNASLRAGSAVAVVKTICATRRAFVRGLKTFGVFGKGWLRRIAGVEAFAVKWALEDTGNPPELVEGALKREAEAAEQQSENAAKRSTVTTTATAASGAVGTTLAPDMTVLVVVLAALAVGGVVALILVHRARAEEERAKAFLEAAHA
jgi:lysozyme family protein